MKKRIPIFLLIIILLIIPCATIYASDDNDNTFAGMDTIQEELAPYLDDIIADSDYCSYPKITEEEIDYTRIRKLYIVSSNDLFRRKISAESLKELILNSEYVYDIRVYRENYTLSLSLCKGEEPEPEEEYSEELLQYLQEHAGKWYVYGIGASDYPLDPALDCFGIMEAYLKRKNIHNAEIYFIDRLNRDASYYAVVFTGQKTKKGEDEILFVAPEQLEYDEEGNLVYSWYNSGIREYTWAEYTYAELRAIRLTGGADTKTLWINIAFIVGVLVITAVVTTLIRRRKKR